ncbi:hypothetical protein EXIGLDRAFT_835369 [Exidia glandulosa HHB12029]|uniref:Uncharacterized protein n=1 Tax=Exidia glandulosa HHB12029 TaxID=1314781 RepID=A0A165IW43_EXIGL|nr:hypothetical protein EXIGLDRAFT_835369 [Exidia glandulosa HHB12029]
MVSTARPPKREVSYQTIYEATETRWRRIREAQKPLDARIKAVRDAETALEAARGALEAAKRAIITAQRALETAEAAVPPFRDRLDEAAQPIDEELERLRQEGCVSPFERLLPELLADIFLFRVESDPPASVLDPPDFALVGRAPFTLASVCRLWRDVALANARVWRNIYIWAKGCTSTLTSGVEIAIQRAGHRNLHFYVFASGSLPPRLRAIVREALANGAVLKLFADAKFMRDDLHWLVDVLPVTGATSLRDLHVQGETDFNAQLQDVAPNLRVLTASIDRFSASYSSVLSHQHVEAVQIVAPLTSALTGAQFSGTLCARVLDAFPNATRISFDKSVLGKIYYRIPLFKHEKLHSLRIDEEGGFPALADEYWLPALEHVSIAIAALNSSSRLSDISGPLHILTHGSSSIKTVYLDAYMIKLHMLIPALHNLLLLEEFDCPNGAPDSSFLSALALPLCPRLTLLRVGAIKDTAIAEQLLDTIALRNEDVNVARLRNAAAVFKPLLDPDAYAARLRNLLVAVP